MAATNLPVIIFLVVLLTQVVAWVGKNVLQAAAFAIYSRVFLSKAQSQQKRLRKQVLTDKAELGKTSSQDEFAKWAKLKRRVDKGMADLEKTNATISNASSTFSFRFSALIWICTTGAQFFIMYWYRSTPIFWLPRGWVPPIVAYVLRFPSAPKGSISAAFWAAACRRVLLTVESIVKTAREPVATPAQPVGVPTKSDKPSARIEELESEKLD